MSPMPITDSIFLLGESREHPLHVGGLQLFQLPDGAGPDYVSDAYRELITRDEVQPLFRKRLRGPVGSIGKWSWTNDDQMDLEYHVRLSALPGPGRVRELLELTSRLHGSLLDRHRPLWEHHLIEGLEGNRFATYTKVHHALLDGVSALRLLRRSLSEDPNDLRLRPLWEISLRSPTRPDAEGRGGGARRLVESAGGAIGDLLGVTPAMVKSISRGLREQAATLPFKAPKTMLNVPITGARRFAAQSWQLARIKAIGTATGATLNDVLLAMCSGALRRYLLEFNALPDRPLIAMVPVSLRAKSDTATAGGNQVGTILCDLGTHLADPADRLARIRASAGDGKAALSGLSPLQILAMSALIVAPLAIAPIPGAVRLTPPPFNLIISNIPGPPKPLYAAGARLMGVYPLSIPYDGQALNITITSYAGSIEIGLTGCRRSVPHLQRLLIHLEDSLVELETATR
jgi:diacylglycerol O-acyltransferase